MATYSGVYVFGDSLVDPGNDLKAFEKLNSFPFVNLPDGAPTADKGYYLGRFTDGYNYADLVSNKFIGETTQATFPYGITNLAGFSIGAVTRPSGNNLSFAYGGAMATQDDPAPSLGTQVSIYHNFTADPHALYIINIGSNDVLSLVPTSGTPVTGAAADQKLASVAQEIANDVVRLLGQGAGHIIVSNIPDLGVVPAYTGSVDEATRRSLLTQYAQTVNADLQTDLNAIAVPSGDTLQVFDFFGYTDSAVSNPAAHDFTNVTQALTSVQPTNPAATGDGFLFFDKLHPTAQAHAQIASLITDELNGVAPSWTAAASIGPQAGASVATPSAVDDFTAQLTGGQTYVIDALGVSSGLGTLADPKVTVVDGAGAVVAQGDDGGVGLDTHFSFTAPSTGTYTVEVAGVGVTSGSFHLQVGDSAGDNLLGSGLLQGSNEAVQGGAENDTFVAAAGANTLMGGDGADSIIGGTGFDQINGNQGDDVIVGRSGMGDWLLGGQGNDWIDLTVSTGHNIVNGNMGNDLILGGSGGDSLRGGQGDDFIHGGAGADWISGDLGHNTLTGGGGADTFHGGAGTDLVTDFNAGAGDHVEVDSGVTYSLSQNGADTVIALSNGGQMTLAGVQSSSLPSGWIITA